MPFMLHAFLCGRAPLREAYFRSSCRQVVNEAEGEGGQADQGYGADVVCVVSEVAVLEVAEEAALELLGAPEKCNPYRYRHT